MTSQQKSRGVITCKHGIPLRLRCTICEALQH